MPMYNLIECSKNYRKTTDSFWNYYRDEPSNPPTDNYNADPITNSASFKYKNSITGKTPNNNSVNNNKKNVEIVVPLKYLSNFWRTVDMPLINCEVNLGLTWSENCALTDIITQAAVPAKGGNPTREAINATFKLADTKLYVQVVTLSTENDNKLLEKLTSGFKRTIKLDKYRYEMSNQTRNNNLNHLIDPTFTKVNRLFVSSFENEDDRNRTSFSSKKYYTSKIEIKDFNVLIGSKSLFDVPIKNKEETYEKITEMGRNNDYTTGNLLNYEYFSKHCKLIAVDLSKQNELKNPDLNQKINFIGRLAEDNATMFSIIEKSEEAIFEFSQSSVTVV